MMNGIGAADEFANKWGIFTDIGVLDPVDDTGSEFCGNDRGYDLGGEAEWSSHAAGVSQLARRA